MCACVVEDREVREDSKHSLSDWSEERRGRYRTFGLVFDALMRVESGVGAGRRRKFLAPEASLGRPAWGFSQPSSFPRRPSALRLYSVYLSRQDPIYGPTLVTPLHPLVALQSTSSTFRLVLSSHGFRTHSGTRARGIPLTSSLGARTSSPCSS